MWFRLASVWLSESAVSVASSMNIAPPLGAEAPRVDSGQPNFRRPSVMAVSATAIATAPAVLPTGVRLYAVF
jgi:hypothetical protein